MRDIKKKKTLGKCAKNRIGCGKPGRIKRKRNRRSWKEFFFRSTIEKGEKKEKKHTHTQTHDVKVLRI